MYPSADQSILKWPFKPIFDVTLVGIINASPDSYLPDSYATSVEAAVETARAHIRGGAHIVEVGGQSGSTFARRTTAEEEARRTLPYIRAIHEEFPQVDIAVDTFREDVARAAIEAGATWLNDVSSLKHDPNMAALVAETGCRTVLMHLDGPGGQHGRYLHRPYYEDVTVSVRDFFVRRLDELESLGVDRRQLVLDVGLGAGKRPAHDYDLLAHVKAFVELGQDIMVGPSRKGFIRIVAPSSTDDLIAGSVVAGLWATLAGVRYLRVHDPKPYAQAIDVWNGLVGASSGSGPDSTDTAPAAEAASSPRADPRQSPARWT